MSKERVKRTKRNINAENRGVNEPVRPFQTFSFDINRELKRALRYHQSGYLEKADDVYKRILSVDPNHSESLHLSGLIAYQSGKKHLAENLIQKAIVKNPHNPSYYNNFGNIHKDQGRIDEAVSCYKKALEIKPDSFGTYLNLGNIFKDQGKLDEAIGYFQKALEINPKYADALNNLGCVYVDLGRPEEAVKCYEKSLEVKPESSETCFNFGNVFKDQGKLNEATAYYKKALEINPQYADALNNLGNVLRDQNKFNEAISCYEAVMVLKPELAGTYYNLGNVYNDQGKLNEAIHWYKKALDVDPKFGKALNNLGGVFRNLSNLNEAIACYKKALELEEASAEICYNLGNVLRDLGKTDEAAKYYEMALKIIPERADTYGQYVHQSKSLCLWQNMDVINAKLDELTGKELAEGKRPSETPFIGVVRLMDRSRHFVIAKAWSDDIKRRMSHHKFSFSFDNRKTERNKITIGYLSNDYHDHATAHLMLSLFGLHNRQDFEIFCYSYGKDDGSAYRSRIIKECDRFIDICHMNHDTAAKCIYEDQVDILVDLKGHTNGNRLEICALRPAPIQVSYLGFPGTTGADFIDYMIVDKTVAPEGHARDYSEKLVYLPHCYQVNDHTQNISNKSFQRKDFGLPERDLVFCSFNQYCKLDSMMFDVWMKILRQVEGSVLWLLRGGETAENNLRHEAEIRKIEPERLFFTRNLPKDEHLARLRLADLALDTRIYNGHTTTSDALWACVPVITFKGTTFASRVSASILTAFGLPELITQSLEAYEDLAIRLSCNSVELQAIRNKILENRLTKPLFDTPRFAQDLENAYKEMWEIFLKNERPRKIEVPAG